MFAIAKKNNAKSFLYFIYLSSTLLAVSSWLFSSVFFLVHNDLFVIRVHLRYIYDLVCLSAVTIFCPSAPGAHIKLIQIQCVRWLMPYTSRLHRIGMLCAKSPYISKQSDKAFGFKLPRFIRANEWMKKYTKVGSTGP